MCFWATAPCCLQFSDLKKEIRKNKAHKHNQSDLNPALRSIYNCLFQ